MTPAQSRFSFLAVLLLGIPSWLSLSCDGKQGPAGPSGQSVTVVVTATPIGGPNAFIGQWGSTGTGNGQFTQPTFLAMDGPGNIYVLDNANRIQKFTPSGNFITSYINPGLSGLAIDQMGNVFVMKNGVSAANIYKLTNDMASTLTSWGGSFGTADGQFNSPYGLATDAAGSVYVADTGNHRVQKFTNSGGFITKWGSMGTGNGQFTNPISAVADSSGNIYVVGDNRVQKFTSTGAYLTQWGSYGTGDGQFGNPFAATVDPSGNVYVTDQNNARVEKFTSSGVFLGKFGISGSSPGHFLDPVGICVDYLGYFYVADYGNNWVAKFGP